MESDRFKALYHYNHWANARVFDTLSRLMPEQYEREMKSGYCSVRDTMVHLISAEWIWLMRVNGNSPTALWSPIDFPTISRLKERWVELTGEHEKFFSGLTEEQLKTPITYVNTQGETFTYLLWQILQHVVNHSSYHRGQITTMLRQLHAEPIATDFLLFYDMAPGLVE